MMLMSSRQRGLTMIELLVAVTLSTVIALAAVAALVVSRRGFTSVDASSQLRDNARFASSMLQRIVGQAGFMDWQFAMVPRNSSTDLPNPDPNISGFDNSFVSNEASPFATGAISSRSGACSTDAGGGCSDILIVRYQAQSVAGATDSDLTMIDCSGAPVKQPPANRDDQGISVFHIRSYKGEPTLMCSYGRQTVVSGVATPTWPFTAPATYQQAVPIIQGVENFQVLYGVDGVTANTELTTLGNDTVPDTYLRADQMVVPGGDAIKTNRLWRRVRSVRIGMVIRGPAGSQQEFASQTFYPFGLAKDSSGGTPGYAMSTDDSGDKGTRFTPNTDGRLRQVVTFTIYLHNDQGLCVGTECAVQ